MASKQISKDPESEDLFSNNLPKSNYMNDCSCSWISKLRIPNDPVDNLVPNTISITTVDSANQPIYSFLTKPLTVPSSKKVGSKSHHLMIMTQHEIPVPGGIALSVDFFQPWWDIVFESNSWKKYLKSDSEDLEKICIELKNECKNLQMTDSQWSGIKSLLGPLKNKIFAVRSSSPEEDLEGASFAGGYETVLGVPFDSLKEAILEVFISCLDVRVFLYKMQHGLDRTKPSIAITVQEQIDCQTAGVAFGLNPLNNCMDEAMVNVNYGLGESVVSGIVEPDCFIVDKDDGEIVEKRKGKKEISIWMTKQGKGTEEKENSAEKREKFALTDNNVAKIVNLLRRIESIYNSLAMDIEFGVVEDKVYILQARPITTDLPLPSTLRTAKGNEHYYWDVLQCVQGLDEPMSILSSDAFRKMMFFGGTQRVVGLTIVDKIFPPIGRFETAIGKWFADIGVILYLAPSFRQNVKYMDPQTYSIIEANKDKIKPVPVSKIGLIFYVLLYFPIFQVLKNMWTARRDAKASIVALNSKIETVFDRVSQFIQNNKVLGPLKLTVAVGYLIFDIPIEFIPRFVVGTRLLTKIHQMIDKACPDTEETKVKKEALQKSLPGNKTVLMGLKLCDIASALKSKGFSFKNGKDLQSELNKNTIPEEIQNEWRTLLEEVKHRGDTELDLATKRYADSHETLLEQIVIQMKAPENSTAREIYTKSVSERESAFEYFLEKIKSKLGNAKAQEFAQTYEQMIYLGGLRESPKFYIIKCLALLRNYYKELGDDLYSQGRLESPQDVFGLHLVDLDQAIKDSSFDLIKRRRERGVLRSKWVNSVSHPKIIDSRGRFIRAPTQISSDPNLLIGFPISAGEVKGIARVLHRPDEKSILPGEILVAKCTNPGWTPLFINAEAVVLEIGGILQHGGLVAREYGIPCVGGIDNVMDRIKDGQNILVNGNDGTVKILSE